ncbi:MAG: sigma-70 family RNA polymerase sigma factor [Planctomycetes bacterium]|nr:sigma-70 family RNA polymerase sigma factor [Planctomycetota bacterium]
MDPELDLARLQAFDDSEWAALEARYAERLRAFVRRRVADPEACEDVLQETLLGAVRGIPRFDPRYTLEQYLFGICRNRTIDHLRRGGSGRGVGLAEEEEGDLFERLPVSAPSPSSLVHRDEAAEHGAAVLREVLREWVAETWSAGEFERLLVVEALLLAGRRNRDVVASLGIEDESAVAGIKFRALKRMAALAAMRTDGGRASGAAAEESGWAEALRELASGARAPLELAEIWRASRASCPARHWLARWRTGELDAGPARFLQAHVDEHGCPACGARVAELQAQPAQLTDLLAHLRESQVRHLGSRLEPPVGGAGGAPPPA